MKICHLSSFYDPDNVGGTETYLKNLISEQIKQQPVVVITSTKQRRYILRPHISRPRANLTVYRYYPLNFTYYLKLRQYSKFVRAWFYLLDLWNIQAYFMTRSILRREKPDVVHTHVTYGISPLSFSAIASQHINHCHTLHDYQLIEPGGAMLVGDQLKTTLTFFERLFIRVKKLALRKVNLVLSPSKFVWDMHRQYGYFADVPHQILPLGVPPVNIQTRKSLSSPFQILFIGQVTKIKGPHLLIKAVKSMSQPDIRLVICGVGPYLDYCRQLAIGDKRIEFAGFVSGEQKNNYFSTSHVLAVPSIWYDNSPVVIYEAMAYGMPIIGSRIGGIPELVNDRIGTLVTPGCSEELAQAIINLKNNQARWQTMSVNCREEVKQYSFAEHEQTLLKLYHSIIT